jgi:hypothetical protein
VPRFHRYHCEHEPEPIEPYRRQLGAKLAALGYNTFRLGIIMQQLCDFELLGELASSVADPVDVDRDVPWSAEYLVVPVRRRINQEPRVLYPTNELADRDLSLQPR